MISSKNKYNYLFQNKHVVILILLFVGMQFIFVSSVTEFIPETIIKPKTNRGLMIDAGSGGSRLHVFRWDPRIFKTLPPEISYPSQDEKWTSRISPGIADLAGHPALITSHLVTLLHFAKSTLSDSEESFKDYPIFFKATGGMRQIPLGPREDVMTVVRSVLSNKTLCPFYFHNDMARVISGEEEAIYSWAAVNFLMGTLLPASRGTGAVLAGNTTYGTLDLGGASTQIAFFIPSQDISEGLFKFQIGGQKHWNVYTKSFLQFGHVSARTRHVTGLADDAVAQSDLSAAVVPEALDYCFFSGYSENVYPISAASRDIPVLISGPPVPAQDQFDRCLEQVKPLLVKYNNDYCNVVYSGQCSINGAYQPSVNDVKHFIGTSSYRYPWKILLLPDTAPLSHFRKRAEFVCSMSFSQIIHYYEVNNFDAVDDKLGEMIPNYCFLATYTYALLTDGYGFRADQSITVLDQVRGNKVSWALGAILYEINTMPWELDMTWYLKRYILFFWLGIVLTVAVGCGVVWYFRHILVRIVYEKMYNRINDGQNTSMEVSSGIHSYQNINSIYDPKTISSSTLSYQPYNKNDDKNNSNVSQASTIIWNETDQLLTAANLNYNQQNHTNHVSYQNANSNTWMNTDGVKSNRIYDDSSSNDSSPCRNKFMFHHHRPKKTYLDRYSAGQTLPTILSNTSTLVTIDTEENQGIYPSSSHLSSFQALSSINTITNDNISNSATQIEYNNNNSETNIGNKKLAPVSLSVSPATTVATTDSLLYYETLSPMQDGGIEVD